MQVSVETTNGLERKLTITIPAAEIDPLVDAEVAKMAKTADIQGFRPGKAPLKLIYQRVGPQVRADVTGRVMQEHFNKALKQEKLTIASRPTVDVVTDERGQDFVFTATFEVTPEFTLKSLQGVAIEQISSEITPADIDSTIEKVRGQHKSFEDVDRPSEKGDKLVIDFKGFKDDEPFEGGEAQDFEMELGNSQMIPGFEDDIIGKKAGESFSINVTFPEAYHEKSLAGQPARFDITVKKVKGAQLPELNEDFVKKLDVKSGNLEDFKKEIEKSMQRELKNALEQLNKTAVFKALQKQNTIDLPKGMVDMEIQQLQEDLFKRVSSGNPNMDMSKMPTLPRDMFEKEATQRVHMNLLASEYMSKNELKAESDKVDAHLQQMAQAYTDPEEVVQWYKSDKERLAQIEAAVLEQEMVQNLLNEADVTVSSLSYTEVMERKSQPPADEKEASDTSADKTEEATQGE